MIEGLIVLKTDCFGVAIYLNSTTSALFNSYCADHRHGASNAPSGPLSGSSPFTPDTNDIFGYHRNQVANFNGR